MRVFGNIVARIYNDAVYEEAVMNGDFDEAVKMLISTAGKNGYVKSLYRTDSYAEQTGFNVLSYKDSEGVFYADNKHYYLYSPIGWENWFEVVDHKVVPGKNHTLDKYLLCKKANLYDTNELLKNMDYSKSNQDRMVYRNDDDEEVEDMTDSLASRFSGKGYDGIILRGIQYIDKNKMNPETGSGMRVRKFDEYAIYNSNVIKLVAITYDDGKKLIPLSKRFDFGNFDVRY
jgi:hypothetical protein